MLAICTSASIKCAQAQPLSLPRAQEKEHTETGKRREFLNNLGFNDISKEIQSRLDAHHYLSELNRRQMINNIKSYETVNAARDLSLLILDQAAISRNDLHSENVRKHSLFAAKMLAMQPLSPSTDFPSEIMSMKEGKPRDEALVNWMSEQRIRQMNTHKDRLLSDLVTLLYGTDDQEHKAQIEKMDQYLSTIVERMYMDDTIGNARYFGRALTALLIREEKLANITTSPIKDTLSRELTARYNLHLENFIGDTLVIDSSKGPIKHTVENGTMMLTQNLTSGSLNISLAAIPANLGDRWRARLKGIVGTPLATPLFVEPEEAKDGITLAMRIRDRIAESNILREGFSHIVYFVVKEDEATGIKMARIIDNYPNRLPDETSIYTKTGGTRFTYLEEFTYDHQALYFAEPKPNAVKAWSQQNLKENGYQSEFFPSIEVELDESGTIPVKNANVVNWQTAISKDEFLKIHSEGNAEKLSRDIWSRFTKGLEQSVDDSWTFHWPDPYDFYLIGSTYCSQLGEMVMRMYVGMPLEQHQSQWHWFLKGLAHIGDVGTKMTSKPALKKWGERLLRLPGVQKAMKLTKIKIISPTSLVMQPYMTGEKIVLKSGTLEQRAQYAYMANDYLEADPKLTHSLKQDYTLTELGKGPLNYVDIYAAGMRNLEYSFIKRGSLGITTEGFNVTDLAKVGSEKATETLNDICNDTMHDREQN